MKITEENHEKLIETYISKQDKIKESITVSP